MVQAPDSAAGRAALILNLSGYLLAAKPRKAIRGCNVAQPIAKRDAERKGDTQSDFPSDFG